MSNNTLSYIIDNEINKITYTKNIDKILINDINLLKSDQRILFVYDKNISKKFINKLKIKLKLTGNIFFFKEIEGKKNNKSLNNLLKLFNLLIKNKFTKNSIIISCGGGVVGDMCGLLSSLYLRGTIYFHIPTTMTAIVDSCIGGKTGINYKGIINSMGSYHHPRRVYISEQVIKDIPDREYFSGFAEIIKCGLIRNKKIIKYLKDDKYLYKRINTKNLSKIILETLKTKIFFFKDDIKEKNKRLNLNFGHTFAHSMEMITDKLLKKDYLQHGEAVGLGMLCEIMMNLNNNNKSLFELTEKLLNKFSLPTRLKIPENFKKKIHNGIYKGVFLDKKTKYKHPRYISLKKIGFPKIKEINDYGMLNSTIYKITKSN
jgi:3-dehydroquinate synthase